MHDADVAVTCTICHEQVDEDDPERVRQIRMVEDVDVIDSDGDGDVSTYTRPPVQASES